jgi:hypothetical protein
MKELAEIERDYIKNIIEFFCRKSLELFLIGRTTSSLDSCKIQSWVENHIRKRLLENNLIYD